MSSCALDFSDVCFVGAQQKAYYGQHNLHCVQLYYVGKGGGGGVHGPEGHASSPPTTKLHRITSERQNHSLRTRPSHAEEEEGCVQGSGSETSRIASLKQL